jgi:hypothetical protein
VPKRKAGQSGRPSAQIGIQGETYELLRNSCSHSQVDLLEGDRTVDACTREMPKLTADAGGQMIHSTPPTGPLGWVREVRGCDVHASPGGMSVKFVVLPDDAPAGRDGGDQNTNGWRGQDTCGGVVRTPSQRPVRSRDHDWSLVERGSLGPLPPSEKRLKQRFLFHLAQLYGGRRRGFGGGGLVGWALAWSGARSVFPPK